MNWKGYILVLASLALVPSGVPAADDTGPASDNDFVLADIGPIFTDGLERANHEPLFLARGQGSIYRQSAARFGWWATSVTGNRTKIGEYQGLDSSAFYDFDQLASDGDRTLDFHVTGPNSESTDLGLRFFGPNISADIDYQRFIHRLDHDPLAYFDDTDSNGSYIGAHTDVNAGEDYAIRINKFDTRFKGHITENVKWKLNVWGMRKQGERQQNAMNHACSDHVCHLQSVGQKIDWMTTEIQPVIEAKIGPATVEYSRTIRSFTSDSSEQGRSYTGRPVYFDDPSLSYGYGQVSDNYTQIDRIKIGADLTENTQFYTNMFTSDTKNRNRGTHRNLRGFDIRVTNNTLDDLTLTGFAKHYEEKGHLPTTFPEDGLFQGGHEPSGDIRAPIDRTTTKAGFKSRWRPFGNRSGFSVTSGYDYKQIARRNVTYDLRFAGGQDLDGQGPFTQNDTIANTMKLGTAFRFSKTTDSFLRYKMTSVKDPLTGFRTSQEGNTFDQALNSGLPEHEDLIELGGTWAPNECLYVSATFGIQKRHNSSYAANFDEDDYPIVVSAWYAPTSRWALSGGLGFYSNWINQDITIGTDNNVYGGGQEGAHDIRFNYGGRTTVINLGTTYAATNRFTLTGGLEFVRARNGFSDPSIPGLSLTYLPGASDVLTETTRLSAGFDYLLRDGISTYFRYSYYNWNDKAGNGESGTANLFLTGITATF